MTKSIYDKLDLLEDAASSEEVLDQDHERDLGRMKEELSDVDDGLGEITQEVEHMVERFHDEDLSMLEIKEFFLEYLPDMISTIAKTRERLY